MPYSSRIFTSQKQDHAQLTYAALPRNIFNYATQYCIRYQIICAKVHFLTTMSQLIFASNFKILLIVLCIYIYLYRFEYHSEEQPEDVKLTM